MQRYVTFKKYLLLTTLVKRTAVSILLLIVIVLGMCERASWASARIYQNFIAETYGRNTLVHIGK